MSRNRKIFSKVATALVKASTPYIRPDLLLNPWATPAADRDSFLPSAIDPERLAEVRIAMQEELAREFFAKSEATVATPPEFKACYIVAGSRNNTGTTEPAAAAVTASGAGGPSGPATAPVTANENAFQILDREMRARGIPVTAIQGVGSYPSAAAEVEAKEAFDKHLASGVILGDPSELSDSGEGIAAALHDPGKLTEHIVTGLTGRGETGLAARTAEIVAAVKKDIAEGKIKAGDAIQLTGHSRGAVAILQAAHILSADPATKNLRLTLFLNDPVAGPGNEKFEHFFLPPNVDRCYYYHALETRTPGFANIPLSGPNVTHVLVPDNHSGMIKGEGTSLLPGNTSRDFFVTSVLDRSFADDTYTEAARHTAEAMQTHFDAAAEKHRTLRGDSADEPPLEVDAYDDSISDSKRDFERRRAYGGETFSPVRFSSKGGGVTAEPFSGAAFGEASSASEVAKRVAKGTAAKKPSSGPGLV